MESAPLPLPDGFFPVESPKALLLARKDKIHRIEEQVGTTPLHFKTFFMAALLRLAAYVQKLPASFSHHHACPGGLLDHTLEVIEAALRLRLSVLWTGKPIEAQVKVRDLWVYALFSACLLHDVGKPAASLEVTVFTCDGKELPFDPFGPFLGEDPKIAGYRFGPRLGGYSLHARIAPLLAGRILGDLALSWLALEPAVFEPWLLAVSGDLSGAGILGELVSQADRCSVSNNLGATFTAQPGGKTKTVSLPEKLAAALRHLIEIRQLPLNGNGAAGWKVGESLWMVAKRTLDALRAHLLKEGHSGVPSGNERLMDVLQEHGLLLPNPAGRAVWRVTVEGQSFAHELTVLCFPVPKLWPQGGHPEDFAGRVSAPRPPPAQTSAEKPTPLVGGKVNFPPPSQEKASLDSALGEEPKDLGRSFLSWLKEGLSCGRIPYNDLGAPVQVAEGGVLLASPLVFKAYGEACGEDWRKVQRRFLKLDLHARTRDGANVHVFDVRGKHRTSRLSGILLPDPSLLFGEKMPRPNPHIQRFPS